MKIVANVRCLSHAVFLILAALLVVGRPSVAQAQTMPVSLTFDPGIPSAFAGSDLVFFGSLTNSSAVGVDLSIPGFSFGLNSGPTGADLTSAIYFNGDVIPPLTLAANQTYDGPLFTLGTDSGALAGPYTGTVTVQYGSQVIGEDINMIVLAPGQTLPGSGPAVPEPAAAVLLIPGLALLCLGVRRRAARA